MALIDLKTDLKSLKFGSPPAYDRPKGGLSGQPYIKEPFIDSDIVPQSEDFLLRGGLNAPLDAATDVARLTRYFADLKSPRGVLFTAKENALSLTGVRTQAAIFGSPSPNGGIYTPLTTLAQAGVGFLGARVPKQGLIPGLGVRLYGPKSSNNPLSITAVNKVIGGVDGSENRLVQLTNFKINKSTPFEFNFRKNQIAKNEQSILSYIGGPNSPLGIGTTRIKFATDNKGVPFGTGLNNPKLLSTGFFATPSAVIQAAIGVGSAILGQTAPQPTLGGFDAFKGGSYTTIDAKEKTNTSISDFREEIYKIKDQKVSYVTSIAPSYTNSSKIYEGSDGSRINMTSPGLRGDKKSYTAGKIINSANGTGGTVSVVDRVNFQPLYKSSEVKEDNNVNKNDLVKFRIAAILRSGKNEKKTKKVFMHFRAFINSFSDAYNADWSGIKYMGRGEEFYKYGGFTRKVQVSFTVAAQSKPELMAQYKKLNFLASTLAPDYGGKAGSGYMGGVLTTLTMGGWCYELPGFISSVNLEVPQESPWEIAINEEGEPDNTVKEMPHICNVSMDFTPIHTFRPELQDNTYSEDGNGEINTYGEQRYLQLTNGKNNNYVPVSLANAQDRDFKPQFEEIPEK